MPKYLAVQADRLLAEGRVEVERGVHRGDIGQVPAAHFDQRDKVNRIERMAQHEPLRPGQIRLKFGDRQARRTARHEHVGWGDPVDLGEQTPLEILALGRALLDEIGTGDRLGQAVVERKASTPVIVCTGKTQLHHLPPCRRDMAATPALGSGHGIVKPDRTPAAQECRDPAVPDHPRTNGRNGVDQIGSARGHHGLSSP